MAFEQKPVVLKEPPVFETVLDSVCERLREKQVRYSIRRIMEMEDELDRLEKELEEFIGSAHE
jgi:hypothetical protein